MGCHCLFHVSVLLLINFIPCAFTESMSSGGFYVASLRFSVYRIMLSTHTDSFTYSFPVWIPFISFSCLIPITRTSSTVLNKSGKTGHPCLVPDRRRNAFRTPLLSMVFARGFSCVAFIIEVCFLYPHSLENCFYIINGC